MHGNTALVRLARSVSISLGLWASGQSLIGAEATVTRTNWFDRWITNVVEVRMPANRFVNEYHTNWITQLRTNVVDVYSTNRVTRTLTNPVVVEATWTNYVTAYETNWSMSRLTNVTVVQARRTNVVVAYQTNWHTRTLTNQLAVTVLQTNLVDQYHTNLSTLSLTNWETVLLFKTNWITQPVTNVVQIDVPARPTVPVPSPKEVTELKEARAEAAPTAPAPAWTGPLTIEAARTTQPVANNLVEVQLKVRWTGNTAAPLQVQNWRVEGEDGAILLFGQDSEFKRQLPVGKYKVEARVKGVGDDPPIAARGILSVTTRDATIQQKLLARR